jgi:hypothetical protein
MQLAFEWRAVDVGDNLLQAPVAIDGPRVPDSAGLLQKARPRAACQGTAPIADCRRAPHSIGRACRSPAHRAVTAGRTGISLLQVSAPGAGGDQNTIGDWLMAIVDARQQATRQPRLHRSLVTARGRSIRCH